ncbi:DNA-binding protein [Lysobacter sp. D1-1-M9]|uniref:DNA-binding protein n=2 Tax=Novilysobacter TaxID=3382699 RepID=UPI002FC618AD
MARGITQDDVDRAANALLLAGERPTIERVRQFLGTGSPNTVTRLLENWWQGLGTRLQVRQQKVELPDAPPAVAELASQLWEQALAAATTTAQEAVQVQHQEVDAERASLAQEAAVLRQQTEEARELATQAQTSRAEAAVRLQDMQHLIEQQTAQVADLTRQRDEAARRAEQALNETSAWRQRLDAAQAQARTEFEAQSDHLRAVEERAYGEVDRLRQQLKTLDAKSRTDADRHGRRVATLESERAGVQRDLAEATRQLAAERARREVLEQQLAELQQTLKATLRAKKTPGESKHVAKQPAAAGKPRRPRTR